MIDLFLKDEVSLPIFQYLEKLDEYDDPYLILVKAEPKAEAIEGAVEDLLVNIKDKVHAGFAIDERFYLYIGYGESDAVNRFVSDIKTLLDEQHSVNHIAVFRHNCLGEVDKTLTWTFMLMDEVIEESPESSHIKVNDFTDAENWPGIDKYTCLDNAQQC